MKILIVGSGGREHALAWKMAQSPLCKHLYIAPGNPGTGTCGENVAIEISEIGGLKQFCIEK
ncbi:MAG: phosphoribosylamine--glycine ligase, partial [Saprospiraceae bacterium]|nr:phosphoribosylamine--glycine ligase [Saprospiraceae bacterium]